MPAQPMLSEVIESYLDHRRVRYAKATLAILGRFGREYRRTNQQLAR